MGTQGLHSLQPEGQEPEGGASRLQGQEDPFGALEDDHHHGVAEHQQRGEGGSILSWGVLTLALCSMSRYNLTVKVQVQGASRAISTEDMRAKDPRRVLAGFRATPHKVGHRISCFWSAIVNRWSQSLVPINGPRWSLEWPCIVNMYLLISCS